MTTQPRIENYNCDGEVCREPHGPVKRMPIGGGAGLILCQACWAHENRHTYNHNIKNGKDPLEGQEDWYSFPEYGKDSD